MRIVVKSVSELNVFARKFLLRATKKRRGNALVVGLSGNLGSGKTAFAKEIGKVFGIRDTVTSPTFVIERAYAIPRKKNIRATFRRFVHIDAYRLSDALELFRIGWEEIAADPKNLILVEWPERVARAIPRDAEKLKFVFVDEKTRNITWKNQKQKKA